MFVDLLTPAHLRPGISPPSSTPPCPALPPCRGSQNIPSSVWVRNVVKEERFLDRNQLCILLVQGSAKQNPRSCCNSRGIDFARVLLSLIPMFSNGFNERRLEYTGICRGRKVRRVADLYKPRHPRPSRPDRFIRRDDSLTRRLNDFRLLRGKEPQGHAKLSLSLNRFRPESGDHGCRHAVR